MIWVRSSWFQRPATAVAPDLLGCTLVRQLPQGDRLRGRIVETEAYEPGDPACHAYRRRTDRNEAMFAAGGHTYLYLIYGRYHCFNVVTDQKGVGSAVLVRALELEPFADDAMPLRDFQRLAAGPGKLCQVLHLDRRLNHLPLVPESGLWIEPRSMSLHEAIEAGTEPIVQTTRIGLSQGKDLPWRWYLKRSPSVSKRYA